jgi:adenylate cyclase
LDLFLPLIAIFLSTVITVFLNYLFEIKNEQLIKKKFASKVSEEVMKDLLEDVQDNGFKAVQREVSIFFSDVRGFTNISENAKDAENLIEFMNLYMDPMSDIIIKNKGTIDKYIGDAIMAYWNAPAFVKNHEDFAVKSALEQLHKLKDLNNSIRQDNRFEKIVKMSDDKKIEPIDIGIGINTGVAIVGEMGSSKRSDYTVIGDPINLGARLESLCKYYNSRLNISNYTKEKLQEKYIFRYLDLVRVKGKKEPVEIWQIHDFDTKEQTNTLYNVTKEQLNKELDLYHKAISYYKNSKFKEAYDIFLQLNSWENKTNLNIYDIYIERCSHFMIEYPIDFDGIYDHKTKG